MSQRVLSIQSHVVFGYVGNKSATFPLQLLGFDVDALNTVNFSNHTGYSHFSGTRFSGDDLKEVFKGLQKNGLANYSYALTGYLGNASLINATYDIIKEVKLTNPKSIYVLDPVMGDNGKLYVSPEVIPIYRDQLCSLADIITPNQTEAEFLTDLPLKDVSDLKLVFQKFHKMGVKNVIITSSFLTPKLSASAGTDAQKLVYMFASQQKEDSCEAFYLSYPHKDTHFTGTGDLFSALILAWYQRATSDYFSNGDHKSSSLGPLATACEYAVSTIQSVLDLTLLRPFKPDTTTGEVDQNQKKKKAELRLIDSRDNIISPNVTYFAQPLSFD